MIKIIHDCDNTIGIKGCDVDDGMALMYLFGSPDAEVLGVTSTFGNSTIEDVYPNTVRFLGEIGHGDVPVYRGGAAAGDYDNDASRYLAQMAEKYDGELVLLVTGSTTNIAGAVRYNPEFFNQIKHIVMMGGITEPLMFEKGEMKELNFSCDPQATYEILTSGVPVSIITGNNCLKVLFTREEYERELGDAEDPGEVAGTCSYTKRQKWVADYIRRTTDYWFTDNDEVYGIQGYYNWDTAAAAYMMHPELFKDNRVKLSTSIEDLKSGYLRVVGEDRKADANCCVNLPEIGDTHMFTKNIYETWLNMR